VARAVEFGLPVYKAVAELPLRGVISGKAK